MIICRTPFRISFFGGGTDYPVWYQEHGGVVLSTTINRYCYISCRYLPPFFDAKFVIRYSHREEVNAISEIKHPSVRECLVFMNIERGVEVVHTSDIPARSGIGSSSAFTVCLLNALYALKGEIATKRRLAREAIQIEQDIIKENVGSQDQVACAFGGLNKIEFGGDREFYVYPITINKEKLEVLQNHLMLFFTGFTRNASDVAGEQIKNTKSKKTELKSILEMVEEAINILNGNSNRIMDFGGLLHESWLLKRCLTSLITTSCIDEIYNTARQAGAVGGKLLGAGGGGFMLLFVPPEKQQQVKDKLKDILFVPFWFDNLGSQVVFYSTQDFS